MAFAAPQFGGLMQVPTADHDMDMLSDAPEEGHDFDIDVDAMSDAEDRDVDFVLDGGNAPAPGAGPETVDQEMLEATADLKTVDAPMGEPDHVSDEAMDSAVALASQKGDIPVPHERFSNQNTTAVVDAHDSLLAPQQYSGDEISYQSHSVLDATSTVPMASFVTDAKTSDDHTLPTPTDAGVLSIDPNSASRDPQDEEREAEHLPTQTTVGTTSNGPSIPSPDQDRALVAGKDKDLNQADKDPGNNDPGQSGRLLDGTATDSQYHEEDEQAEEQVEGDTLKKSSSSECATLVSYDGSQLSLFPPADGLPEAYMLEDASLADGALRELFVACRQALGASIGDDSQLQIEIPGLHLTIEEDSIECSVVTLFQIVDIHHHLNRNDGIEHLVPLPVTLRTRPRISARLRELAEAVSAAKGYSSFLPEDDDEYDPAENEVDAEEQSEDHDSTDEYGVDSGYENPSALEHDEYQETDGAINESATERDTNSERKSGSDEQDSDQNSTPADNTAEDDRDDYSEDEDELRNVANDSIEPKRDAAAHDLDEESVADESPEEFNVLDPFAGDHGDEGQTLVNDEYAEPKFGEGTSTAEGSGVYLGAHEATLNEEEEYAQLDDWLAPEDEPFGVTNDVDADAVSGEPLGDDEDYGNVNVSYGEEWGNEVEARTSPAKPSSDSPLGKRARERSVDDAEPESDQEAKRVKAT